MSLSTITAKDAKPRTKQLKQRMVSSLSTEDIEGAKPLLRGYQCINKPEFSNFTKDIERACPKHLHPGLNKPSFNLMTSDIEKANPKLQEFVTNRVTNPLNPVYKLPSFETRPITPPKFVRDSFVTNDIEGTKPEIYHKWTTRDTITVNDIEGARPKPERILKKPDFMNPKDINGEPFVTKRSVNPLEPVYVARDADGNLVSIGGIEGAKSKAIIKLENPPHRRNYESSDIEGARPNTVGNGPFAGSKERNYSKKIIDASDIQGTAAGTFHKGIYTKRVTNPLEPYYVWTTEDPVDSNQDQAKPDKNTQPAESLPENNMKNEIQKNNMKFWGVTPSVTRNNSLPPSRPSTSRPASKGLQHPGFQKNLHKFYDQPLPDSVQQAEIKLNTEKFYSNSNPKIADKFISVQNPNTIHRIKKEIPVVNAVEFAKNAKNFCGASDSGSRPMSSQSSYRFTLSRGEIAKPA